VPYVEFLPRSDVAHIVKCVWNYESAAGETDGRPERIVPDGNPELVVHYGHPFSEITAERGKQAQPRVFLMGQMTRPLALDPSQGAPGIMGVRFHPAGVRAMIGAAMDEFTDHHLKVADVAPAATTRLVDQIASAANAAGRAHVLQNFVAERAIAHARFQDTDVARWTTRLARANGRLSVGDLAREAGLSTRQLDLRSAERRRQTGLGNHGHGRRLFRPITHDPRLPTLPRLLTDGLPHPTARAVGRPGGS
jgi:hypothetical protein